MIDKWWLVGAGVGGLGGAIAWFVLHRLRQERIAQQARREFRLFRERLEAKFFDFAAHSGKPRGLRWMDCEWENPITFARDRRTGALTALVGLSIRFEAVEGGPMEDVPAVAQEKVGCALFHYVDGAWSAGRVLFNLSPQQAISRYREQFELCDV